MKVIIAFSLSDKIVFCILFFIVFQLSNSCYAQQGRHELPSDTVPIGGREQKVKEQTMEAHDQLTADLTSVRDSIKLKLVSYSASEMKSVEGKTLQSTKRELDRMIARLKRTDRDPDLMRVGQTLLEERKSFKIAAN